jgi:hypothetical protein
MRMKKGDMIIECIELVRNVWEREGFVIVNETEEVKPVGKTTEITYADMKRIAKENGINSHGMNKDTLLEAIKEYI